MPNDSHEEHVSRHVEMLAQGPGDGVTSAESARYLEAVREVSGESAHSFTRVNFRLAHCSCLEG